MERKNNRACVIYLLHVLLGNLIFYLKIPKAHTLQAQK